MPAFEKICYKGTCDVCGKQTDVAVCASSLGPISLEYCRSCLENRLEPYGIIVACVSGAGRWPDAIAPVCQELVRKNLAFHRKSEAEFAADVGNVLERNDLKHRRDQLASSEEVLELLRTNGADFTALEPIRERYAEQFTNELCWSYPFCVGDYLGCVVLPVQEGILCLPYSSLDSDTYEQFVLEAAGLLTAEQLKALTQNLLAQTAELYSTLSGMGRLLSDASLSVRECGLPEK